MKIFCVLLCSLVLLACGQGSEKTNSEPDTSATDVSQLHQLTWMLGTWEHTNAGEYSKETWTKVNDSTFTGFSYTQAAQDTVFAETLTLQEKNGTVFLDVVAYKQNNDQAVTFELVSVDNSEYIFENPLHDFPKRIVYANPAEDSIHAWVEGRVQGEMRKIDFYFTRNTSE